uniref:folliculin-like n=1 Tax=Styela clava TaxID=7725 RepID=UPI0019393265|nr:folliculin-like [Styela clava]
MNAVIALCHFCEQHGPSVMFCTEKGGLPPQKETGLDALPEVSSSQEIPLGTSYPDSVMSADFSRPCSRQNSVNKSSLCQACRSLPDGHKGFISYDGKTEEVFVSSQHPQNPNVFGKVRQACVRSVSSEVCPGREGPIFYGDENEGYVLSYTFPIKDSLARGFKRQYSIIVVMMDRIYLIQSWPFLVECISKIIAYFQKCAVSVYNSEHAECPQRNTRLKSSLSKTVTPQNFRSNRSSHSNARALVELTGDEKLYSYLHSSFTWLIRACKLRWKENVIYNPPTLEKLSLDENDQTIASSIGSGFKFLSLRHMREVLQPPRFRAIVWHLLIGNQVIWHGLQSAVISAIHTLKNILPKGCANIAEWTTTIPTDKNLIGMPCLLSFKNVRTKDYVIVEVLWKNGIEFKWNSSCVIPEKGPSLLEKLEVALANENLSNEVVLQCLLCLKQEWINKTEILRKFVTDKRNKDDTTDLLQNCLFCNDDDVKMMKFWLTSS